MKRYKWILQPYGGKGTRHRCPNCGRPQSFTRYVKAQDYQQGIIVYAGDDYGRCNYTSCGYQRYPDKEARFIQAGHREELPKIYYSRDDVKQYRVGASQGNLIKYLLTKIDPYILQLVLKDYAVGYLEKGRIWIDEIKSYRDYYNGTVFWQIDHKLNIHRGKVMYYRPDGHREKRDEKRGVIQAMWQMLGRKRENEPDMCYFGQHLCNIYPDKPIAIVESEKTAIVATCVMPVFNWLATSSINNFNTERLQFITEINKPVVIYPDYDGYDSWVEKTEKVKKFFPKQKFEINDSIIKHGNGKQDIADILLSNL